MKILVTGTAGFIGNNLAGRLLAAGHEVVGVDNLNDYYDPSLKEDRLAKIKDHPNFTEERISVEDRAEMTRVFEEHHPRRVMHLAAQAGVRYSLINPHSYIDSNLVGFTNILEGARACAVEHLVYASSSSVYGTNAVSPFSVDHPVDHPISLYAATKRANELMAHTYSHLFNIPTTGLRFFTVYGPWGRPDMALFLFTKAILAGEPINVFNHGNMERSFTYIDDIVTGIVNVLDVPATPTPASETGEQLPSLSATAPFRVTNIGSPRSVKLTRYIELIEENLGREAIKNMMPMQPGDVANTCADVSDLKAVCDYEPSTPVEEGVKRFIDWYRDYYKVG
ncbi:MAG: NAD-dependent epimerase [Magnetospiraceae bacterium]